MTDWQDVQARAKRRLRTVERKRKDPRYQAAIGRYVAAGLLTTSDSISPNREPLRIQDVLWAGELEPRLLELLPALIVKKPALFQSTDDMPADLAAAVAALRRNEVPTDFRGLPGKDIYQWLRRVGHKNKVPSRLKSFRLRAEDLALLEELQRRLGVSQTTVLRRALRALAAQTG